MTYRYELKVEGIVRRRKYHQFNNGIMKFISDDLVRLNSKINKFELVVIKDTWDSKKVFPEIEWRD